MTASGCIWELTWRECRAGNTTAGDPLVQGKGNSFLTAQRVKRDENREAVLDTGIAFAHPGVTLHDEVAVLKCAHVHKTRQVGRDLCANSIG